MGHKVDGGSPDAQNLARRCSSPHPGCYPGQSLVGTQPKPPHEAARICNTSYVPPRKMHARRPADARLPADPTPCLQVPSMGVLTLAPAGVIQFIHPAKFVNLGQGLDLLELDRNNSMPLILRRALTEGTAAMDGPLDLGDVPGLPRHVVVVRKAIFAPASGPNDTFGQPIHAAASCGELCSYNATTGKKFWGEHTPEGLAVQCSHCRMHPHAGLPARGPAERALPPAAPRTLPCCLRRAARPRPCPCLPRPPCVLPHPPPQAW